MKGSSILTSWLAALGAHAFASAEPSALPVPLSDQSIPHAKSSLFSPGRSIPEPVHNVRSEDHHQFPERSNHTLTLEERQSGGYWYESAQHGIAAFGPSGYQFFRNVKDFGAKGDGTTDDTAAINAAITAGNRCGQACGSSTLTPAVVYFPAGTYLVSAPLIQYYYTQFVGNPNSVPTLKASPKFAGIAVISSNTYIPGANGAEWYVPQSNFYRQVRNFIIDISACPNVTPDGFAPTGIHWQVAQATSLQNIQFIMSQAQGTTHIGIFMENGSGGYLGDLTFTGGAVGMRCGNQQFTSRNLTFKYCTQAIEMIWDWGWTWKGLNVFHCYIGINVTSLYSATAQYNQGVSAIAILDSVFTNVPIAVLTEGRTNTYLENVQLNNAPIAIGYPGGPTILNGGDLLIDNYGAGNSFVLRGSTQTMNTQGGPFNPSPKSAASASLRDSSGWFGRSKPQYETLGIGSFTNVKASGARGDGVSDDTAAIQSALNSAAGKSVVYFPHGTFLITDTILIPANSRVVGEGWSEIMATGPKFRDITKPYVAVRVGASGSTGSMEISDLIFTSKGATAGLIMMEWNIAASSQGAAAMWDSHFRIGGAVGTDLQYQNCPRENSAISTSCIAATLLMRMTASSNGYLENVWIWTADHDLDLTAQSQISVYTGRGLLIESKGPTWLWGTASEHSTLYQYHFHQAQNIFGATLQTETPYYQPVPKAPAPFTGAPSFPSDPTFAYCSLDSTTCAYAWGLEIINSSNMMLYGGGFYSWFQWYSQVCLGNEACQERIVRVIGSNNIFIINLYTKGVYSMIQGGGGNDVLATNNKNGFLGTIVSWAGFNVGGSVDGPSNVIPLPPWIWSLPSPTVSCIIPCTILPPPTPVPPIDPPPFTTTVNNQPVAVTPPSISDPAIPVAPIPIVQNPQNVNPQIAPNPVIVVPPVPFPNTNDDPGSIPPILPPPIPLPIPAGLLPGGCVFFCDPSAWPPFIPPIVVVNGPPIPVGAPPPADPDDPYADEADDDAGDLHLFCPFPNDSAPTKYPQPSDVPPWAQSNQTTSSCDWDANHGPISNTVNVQLASGSSSFSVNLFDALNLGPRNRIPMGGATLQAYSVDINGWRAVSSPASLDSSSNANFITFDVPEKGLTQEIQLSGTAARQGGSLSIQVKVATSRRCGGSGIPDPSSGTLPPRFPSKTDGTIDCESPRSDGGGTGDMKQCLWPYGSIMVQGQTLTEDNYITTQNPDQNCIKHGTSVNSDGVTLSSWCMVYKQENCALVIADKDPRFGGFPGFSTIRGYEFRNFDITGAQNCAGQGRTAIAAGPLKVNGVSANTLCLVNPAHPEICAVY